MLNITSVRAQILQCKTIEKELGQSRNSDERDAKSLDYHVMLCNNLWENVYDVVIKREKSCVSEFSVDSILILSVRIYFI